MAFENNAIIIIEKLFDNNNNLIELPSFLFPIENYKDYDTADITLRNKIKYMFNFFLETDKAILNPSNFDINSKDILCSPYILYPSIHVKKNNKQLTIDTSNNIKIVLKKKSINIMEAKISEPLKMGSLDLIEKEIGKNKDYKKTIYYVLCNLINKIKFYKDLVINEFLNKDDNINNYSFRLLLIFDNKPVNEFSSEIIEILKELHEKNIINYHNFEIIPIYIGPNLGYANFE